MALEAPLPFTFRTLWRSASTHSAGKESACNAGDPGSIPASGRSSGEGIGYPLQYSRPSLVAQLVKNLSVVQEIWVRSLGWRRERLPTLPTPVFWPGELHGLQSLWPQRVRQDWVTFTFTFTFPPTPELADLSWHMGKGAQLWITTLPGSWRLHPSRAIQEKKYTWNVDNIF